VCNTGGRLPRRLLFTHGLISPFIVEAYVYCFGFMATIIAPRDHAVSMPLIFFFT
jgi:hypothetical protein